MATNSVYSNRAGTQSPAQGDSAIHGHQLLIEDPETILLYVGVGISRYYCICGLHFTSSPNLIKHLGGCDKNNLPFRQISHYRCIKCTENFSSVREVARHFSNCLGQKPESSAAKGSSTTVTPRKDHGCHFCEAAFKTANGLGQHLRHRHSELRASISPEEKSPRWTMAEDNLVAKAEIWVRSELGTLSSGSCRGTDNNKVYDRIIELCPEFKRSREAVKQRRLKPSARLQKMILDNENRLTPNQQEEQPSLLVNVANTIGGVLEAAYESAKTIADPISANSHGAERGSSEHHRCTNEIPLAISSHLKMLEEAGHNRCLEFLSSVQENLEAYTSLVNLRETLARIPRKRQRTPTSPTQRSTGANKGGKVAAKMAKERAIFERHGPKRCLQHLRDPSDSGLCSRATAELFKSVFEEDPGKEDNEPFTVLPPLNNTQSIRAPITPVEVSTQLKRMKTCAAPGPDSIRVPDLRELDPADLACLFNLFILHENVPRVLKANRTTMIPKSAEPGTGDWRPITMASVIDRLFAKILEARLSRHLRLDPAQRGFIRGFDGCGENITAYSGALRYSRKHGKPLVVTSLDLAKAFDSCQHSTIARALKRYGLDVDTIKLLMNLVRGHETKINHAEGEMNVRLNRGVRQGWPLSPILFLCIIDELLQSLDEANGFQITGPLGEKAILTGVAFADDLILYSSSPIGMQQQLLKAATWCNAHGMRLNPAKSSVIFLRQVPKQKRVVADDLKLSLQGQEIPGVSHSYERVLGIHMTGSGKVDHRIDKLEADLQLVLKSRLRPSQKVRMIRDCLIPMISFRLIHGFATKGACNAIDRKINRAIKQSLHLPKYFIQEALRAPRKEGGLGIPSLADRAMTGQAKLLIRMRNSGNLITRLLIADRGTPQSLRRYPELGDIAALNNESITSFVKKRAEKRMTSLHSSVHGNGWSYFKNAPRCFLDDPRARGWTERNVIEALKMRTGVLLTREFMARTMHKDQNISTDCRGCGDVQESQDHILSVCSSTQVERQARHDRICQYLARRLLKGNSTNLGIAVHRELTHTIEPGETPRTISRQTLKPDLTVITPTQILLIEVSVVYENKRVNEAGSLHRVRRDKKSKYEPLRKVLSTRLGKPVVIRTLIVGCRGGWIASNNKVFNGSGVSLTRLDREVCVEKAIWGSITVYHRFLNRTRQPLVRHLPEPVAS